MIVAVVVVVVTTNGEGGSVTRIEKYETK